MECYSLCLYLVVFLRVTSALSNEDFFQYRLDFPHSEHHIGLELLDDENAHILQKRELPTELTPPSPSPNVTTNNTAEATPTSFFKKKSIKLQKDNYPSNITDQLATTLPGTLSVNVSSQSNITVPQFLNETIYKSKTKTEAKDTDITNRGTSTEPTELDDDDLPDPDTREGYDEMAAKHNLSVVKAKIHYYNSVIKNDSSVGQHYWVDLTNRSDVKINDLLSKSHRRAATVKLSFEFPFYGHLIKSVTIATGGFLYTGDYVHSWLAATQYIAPLMANFDTRLSNDSFIRYVDNGTSFTVEWDKVRLQEGSYTEEFTFQVTLHKNGDIIFVYKNVPLPVEDIADVKHPVKVGLSDAYIMDRTIFYVRRKTIYEYDRVEFKKGDIGNWTVIYLTPLPTCLDYTDCVSCLNRSTNITCAWCPTLKKCSNGIDRHRQNWLAYDCSKRGMQNVTMCSYINSTDKPLLDDIDATDESAEAARSYAATVNKRSEQVGISGIIATLFLICVVSGLAIWIFYAYKNPHTTSGQMLIKYRPSQWRWRRGEARYTAATIHM